MTRFLIGALGLVVATGHVAIGQSPTRQVPREFEHVKTMGRALAEYRTARLQIVAAYYYSQTHHDSSWLLIELGAMGSQPTKIERDHIEIVTPRGRVVPLATQTQWGEDPERSTQMLQQAATTRHQIGSYFKNTNGGTGLRFFVHPRGAGTVLEFADLAPDQAAYGDLLFQSPTRLWDKGVHALVVRYDGGEAMLPIDLQ